MSIHLTRKAADQVLHIIKKNNHDEQTRLRVSVTAGGCSGFEYQLGFDKDVGEGDLSFDSHGVTVVTDKLSYQHLKELTIDFTDGLQGRGFIFKNPNATGTCGCGESFSV